VEKVITCVDYFSKTRSREKQREWLKVREIRKRRGGGFRRGVRKGSRKKKSRNFS
jgi:hypothetical protein